PDHRLRRHPGHATRESDPSLPTMPGRPHANWPTTWLRADSSSRRAPSRPQAGERPPERAGWLRRAPPPATRRAHPTLRRTQPVPRPARPRPGHATTSPPPGGPRRRRPAGGVGQLGTWLTTTAPGHHGSTTLPSPLPPRGHRSLPPPPPRPAP